uniref:Uncharacterized protein n=1 Tax=Tanacetum cinerariifolium TaxID=118510 RepID=A0A6L2KL74_TANCI|nr:hypothetical protein [Tanacetum cinerariifolium]
MLQVPAMNMVPHWIKRTNIAKTTILNPISRLSKVRGRLVGFMDLQWKIFSHDSAYMGEDGNLSLPHLSYSHFLVVHL